MQLSGFRALPTVRAFRSQQQTVAFGLSPADRAFRLTKSARETLDVQGFWWPDVEEGVNQLQEEMTELKDAVHQRKTQKEQFDELGDVIFTAVGLAHYLNLDPARALRHAAEKMTLRLQVMKEVFEKANPGKSIAEAKITKEMALPYWRQAKAQIAKAGMNKSALA